MGVAVPVAVGVGVVAAGVGVRVDVAVAVDVDVDVAVAVGVAGTVTGPTSPFASVNGTLSPACSSPQVFDAFVSVQTTLETLGTASTTFSTAGPENVKTKVPAWTGPFRLQLGAPPEPTESAAPFGTLVHVSERGEPMPPAAS